MSRKTTSLTVWQSTPEQVYASKLLAHRRTWQETADEVGVNIATIGRWHHIPQFLEMINAETALVARALDHQLVSGAEEMLDLWRKMIRGEVPASDKRLDRIEAAVNRYFASAIAWDDAPSTGKSGAPGMAVQFNIGSAGNGGGDTR